MPMIALILSVIASVISLVPGGYLSGDRIEKGMGLFSAVLAIVLLLLTVMFFTWFGDSTGSTGFIIFNAKVSFGIGAYVCLADSILPPTVRVMTLFKGTGARMQLCEGAKHLPTRARMQREFDTFRGIPNVSQKGHCREVNGLAVEPYQSENVARMVRELGERHAFPVFFGSNDSLHDTL